MDADAALRGPVDGIVPNRRLPADTPHSGKSVRLGAGGKHNQSAPTRHSNFFTDSYRPAKDSRLTLSDVAHHLLPLIRFANEAR